MPRPTTDDDSHRFSAPPPLHYSDSQQYHAGFHETLGVVSDEQGPHKKESRQPTPTPVRWESKGANETASITRSTPRQPSANAFDPTCAPTLRTAKQPYGSSTDSCGPSETEVRESATDGQSDATGHCGITQNVKEVSPPRVSADSDDVAPRLGGAPRQPSIDLYEPQGAPKLRARAEKDPYRADPLGSTKPGAVRLRGCDILTASSMSLSTDGASKVASTVTEDLMTAEVGLAVEARVVLDEEIEGKVEDRFRERADELADHVMQRLRQNVVEAAQVEVTKESEEMMAIIQRRQRIYRLGGCFLCTALVAVIIVVVVLETSKPDPSIAKISPSSTPTSPPTPRPTKFPPILPTTFPPSTAPTRMPDMQSNPSESVAQLIDGASNHQLFVRYFKRDTSNDLVATLSKENVTLFAPTDQSVMALQQAFPYAYYFTDSLFDYWSSHLYLLWGSHIVRRALSAVDIFRADALPTYIPSFELTVNVTSMTIENGATIIDQDIRASNGFIQIPDKVLLVPQLTQTLAEHVMETSGHGFNNNITTFRILLELSGLHSKLVEKSPHGFAIFVPTNDAFAALNQTLLQSLLSSPNDPFTQDLILYHMIDFNLYQSEENACLMLNNATAWFTLRDLDRQAFVNKAKFVNSYIVQDGFIHVIDQVLVPPNLGELLEITSNVTTSFNFTTFLDIVQGSSHLGNLLKSELEGYSNLENVSDEQYLTVFAPVNDAFAPIASSINRWLQQRWLLHLQSVIRHHFTLMTFPGPVGEYKLEMLSGFQTTVQIVAEGNDFNNSNNTIDGIKIIHGSSFPTMAAENGLIHAIDEVLLPPWVDVSIYGQLHQDPDFSNITALIQSSGVVGVLNATEGPWTLLAPSNKAFGNMLNAVNRTFANELIHRHIFPGNLYAPRNVSIVVARNSQTLQFQRGGNITLVGGAQLLKSNWLASNGVIHVIDRVL